MPATSSNRATPNIPEAQNVTPAESGHLQDEQEVEDEEDEGEHLTGAGKAMKKLMRKVDGGAYESDDDKNPYASSVRFLPNNGGLLAVLFLGIPC